MRGDSDYSSKHQHGVVEAGRASSGAHLPQKTAKHWWDRKPAEGGTAEVEAQPVEGVKADESNSGSEESASASGERESAAS